MTCISKRVSQMLDSVIEAHRAEVARYESTERLTRLFLKANRRRVARILAETADVAIVEDLIRQIKINNRRKANTITKEAQ